MSDSYIAFTPLEGLGMDEVVRLRRELGEAEMGWNKRAERAEAEIERLRTENAKLEQAMTRYVSSKLNPLTNLPDTYELSDETMRAMDPCRIEQMQSEIERLREQNKELLTALKAGGNT